MKRSLVFEDDCLFEIFVSCDFKSICIYFFFGEFYINYIYWSKNLLVNMMLKYVFLGKLKSW